MLGRFSIFCSFLLRYFGSLYEGACMLLITGLMGVPSLCVLKNALSFGAIGFFVDEVFTSFFFKNEVYILAMLVGSVFGMLL